MNQKSKNTQGGFMALISAIIIALLLITITVSLNFAAFFGRFNVLDSEFKETSLALAEACADTAILEIAKGNTPSGDVFIGSDKCTIVSVTGSSTKTILIQAVYKKSYTNLKVIVTPSPTTVTINSWIECANACI